MLDSLIFIALSILESGIKGEYESNQTNYEVVVIYWFIIGYFYCILGCCMKETLEGYLKQLRQMYIKNNFLRFILSGVITLLIYFMAILVLTEGDDVLEAMVIFAVFGLFIVVPALLFIWYLSYQLLTTKSERSKKAPKIIKNSIIFLGIVALLYVAAMYTDLFG